MRYGVCCGPDSAEKAKRAGYDYFEWSVPALLKPREGDAAFRQALAQVHAAPLPCEALNCLIPADLKVTGPVVDRAALEAYMHTAMTRAGAAGVKVVVFGSGGARKVPDGFDRATAEQQVVWFLKMGGGYASAAGVMIVIEPLNRSETNIVNSVEEGVAFMRRVNHPAVRMLVDGFHLMREHEPVDKVVQHAATFAHMHVATNANRRYPGNEPCEGLPAFLAAVHRSGYTGRMSVEASLQDPAQDLPRALKTLRDALSPAGAL
jgi:D-psicose/D-tagatose/L-ribulose 3-epimerase